LRGEPIRFGRKTTPHQHHFIFPYFELGSQCKLFGSKILLLTRIIASFWNFFSLEPECKLPLAH
jgi:hypothetical protein